MVSPLRPAGDPAVSELMMNAENFLRNVEQAAFVLAGRRSLHLLRALAEDRGLEVYLVGGTVREMALGGATPDVDLAVSGQALALGRALADALGGTYVLLDEKERTARVVCGEEILDLAEFRAPTLEGDLKGRDFTINALALNLRAVLGEVVLALIDPLGGLHDLAQGLIRLIDEDNLAYDPLRLLRAYRFAATHGFAITPETRTAIACHAEKFSRVAGERVHQELFAMLAAPRSARWLWEMAEVRLLFQIFPELADLENVPQDGFHHLDVFRHSLETACQLEEVLGSPERFLGDLAEELTRYCEDPDKRVLLKLGALFHDAGKPQVQERRAQPARYTFYHHERVGVQIFENVAARLRLSTLETRTVIHFIRWHMRPFLLLPAFCQGKLTVRALGRLVRAARPELPGCFALAMADSLAAQGRQKPENSEKALAALAEAAYRFLKDRLEPQELRPRLVTGHDLQQVLGLRPGPHFKRLLTAVEEAQWDGQVTDREEALALVRRLL
jgi:poly(A) polymerase